MRSSLINLIPGRLVCLALITIGFSAHAQEGSVSGGGAGGVACSLSGKSTFELLDFWEGKNLKGLQINTDSDERVFAQLSRATNFLEKRNLTIGYFVLKYGSLLNDALKRAEEGRPQHKGQDQVEFLAAGVTIAPPHDALTKFTQRECKVEGLAYFSDLWDGLGIISGDDPPILSVDRVNYLKLSKTGIAGLVFHEAVYLYLRKHFNVTNSIVARNITACAFATTPCPELDPQFGIPSEGPLYECSTGSDSVFKVFKRPETSDLWRFQLIRKGQDAPPTKSYFDLSLPDMTTNGEMFAQAKAIGDIGVYDRLAIKTRSSQARWSNIGIPFGFSITTKTLGVSKDGRRELQLLIDEKPVRCTQQR